MRDLNGIIKSTTVRRWRVTSASGEWTWTGSPKEIVSQMSAIEHPGTVGETYMERVRNRVSAVHGVDLHFNNYSTFLKALEEAEFVFIEKNPIKKPA